MICLCRELTHDHVNEKYMLLQSLWQSQTRPRVYLIIERRQTGMPTPLKIITLYYINLTQFFFLWRAPQQMLRTHRSLEAYCATLWWRWLVFFVFPCNGAPVEWNWQGKTDVLGEKTCPSATLSTTNPTYTYLGPNPGLRGSRPATGLSNAVR
jgi:hypothetical protein